jgi:hypothetical protein
MPKPVTVYSSIDILNQMYVDLGYRQVLFFWPIFSSNAQNCHNKINTYLLLIQFHHWFKLTGPESNYVTIGNQLITELLFESGTTWTRETGLTISKC